MSRNMRRPTTAKLWALIKGPRFAPGFRRVLTPEQIAIVRKPLPPSVMRALRSAAKPRARRRKVSK